MDMIELIRLLPTIEMIAEEFPGAQAFVSDPKQAYCGVRVFGRQSVLQKDILYLLREEDIPVFPADQYSSISTGVAAGAANHIRCSGQSPDEILEQLLELFARFREQELLLDQMVYRNASLQELCEVGAEMLDNPVYIHDDWFIMIAMSSQVDQVMPPEYVMSSSSGFVPRFIVDDFKYDSDYLETYAHRNAQIWSTGNGVPRCLYVNLWEGTVYRGRLLIIETNRPIRHADFIIAQVLTQRAMFLLRGKQLGGQTQHRSMDHIVFDLLQGIQPDPADLSQLLGMLNWSKSDSLACIRIRNQQTNVTAVMEHLIHSDLFRTLPGSYILLSGHQQCVILNLTRQKSTLAAVRHQLAPLCRDYCLYAGISSPVTGVRELHLAYYQANIALEQAFQLRSERWIIAFPECALEHMVKNLNAPLQPLNLVAPELNSLIDHDREKGTQYFETFREYLLQERDIPKTAEKLIIHRTTPL